MNWNREEKAMRAPLADHVACLLKAPQFYDVMFWRVRLKKRRRLPEYCWTVTPEGLLGESVQAVRKVLGRFEGPIRIAEVGSCAGRGSTRLFIEHVRKHGGELVCVDNWEIGQHTGWVLDNEDLYRLFLSNVRIFGGTRFTQVLKMTSEDGAKRFPDGHFDLVFVDAGHDYENCKADILAWRSKVRPGGILFGHDYRDHARYYDRRDLQRHCHINGETKVLRKDGRMESVMCGVVLAVQETIGEVEVAHNCWIRPIGNA